MHNVDLKSGFRWLCAANRKRLCSLPILLSLLFVSTACLANGGSKQAHAVGPAQKLQTTLWWRIAKQHRLDPYILYAVALKESANDADPASVKPWPWALNKSGKALMPASRQSTDRCGVDANQLALAWSPSEHTGAIAGADDQCANRRRTVGHSDSIGSTRFGLRHWPLL